MTDRSKNITADVVRYLRTHPNEEVALPHLAKALGCTPREVSNTNNNVRRILPTFRVIRPGWWIYTPLQQVGPPREELPSALNSDLWEEIGTSRDGRRLLRSTTGVVGRLEEL